MGHEFGVETTGGLFKNEGKLIAAGAGDGVEAADAAGEKRADLLQKHIAGVVSECVVDLLEVIEIDDEDGSF